MIDILKDLDWSPLIISLKTGLVATFLSFFLGLYTARKMMKAGPRTRAIMDGILTLPSSCLSLAEEGLLVSCYTSNSV